MSNVPLQQQNFDKSSFIIKVDTSPADYAPGDLIRGHIYLRLLREIPIQALEIRLHGEMMSPMAGTNPGQTPQQRDITKLFDSSIFLMGRPPSSQNKVSGPDILKPGNHNFPFQFQFPTSGFIPSSFRMAEFLNGYIEYKLIARLSFANIPKADDIVDVRILQVRERTDVSLAPLCNPLTHNATSDNKNSQISITVPHIGFIPGEVVQIAFTYTTNEYISIPHTLRVGLEQQVKGLDNKIFHRLIRTTNIPFAVNEAVTRSSGSIAIPNDLSPPTIFNHKHPRESQKLSVMYVLVTTVERTIDKNASKAKGIFRKSQQLVAEPVLHLAAEIVVGTRRGSFAPQQPPMHNAPFPMQTQPPPYQQQRYPGEYSPSHNRPPPQPFYPVPNQPLQFKQPSYPPPQNQHNPPYGIPPQSLNNPPYGTPPQNIFRPPVYGPPVVYPSPSQRPQLPQPAQPPQLPQPSQRPQLPQPPQSGYPPENRRPPPENLRFPPDQRTPPLGPERSSRPPSPPSHTDKEEIVLEPVTATDIPPPIQRKYSFDAEDFVYRA